MNITITLEVTLRSRLRNMSRWGFTWFVRLAGLGLLGLGLLLDGNVVLLVLAGVYLFGPELLILIAYPYARRFGTRYVCTLTESGIETKTAISTTQLAWTAFKSIRQTSDCWRFRLSGLTAITLPKSRFTPEQAAEWEEFVRRSRVLSHLT